MPNYKISGTTTELCRIFVVKDETCFGYRDITQPGNYEVVFQTSNNDPVKIIAQTTNDVTAFSKVVPILTSDSPNMSTTTVSGTVKQVGLNIRGRVGPTTESVTVLAGDLLLVKRNFDRGKFSCTFDGYTSDKVTVVGELIAESEFNAMVKTKVTPGLCSASSIATYRIGDSKKNNHPFGVKDVNSQIYKSELSSINVSNTNTKDNHIVGVLDINSQKYLSSAGVFSITNSHTKDNHIIGVLDQDRAISQSNSKDMSVINTTLLLSSKMVVQY